MRILQINQNYNQGSTGRIMREIGETMEALGYESFMLCAYSLEKRDNLYIMEKIPRKWAGRKNELIQRITGMSGYTAWGHTKIALNWIEQVNPDIIHLHNIHGDWINIEMLFSFLKKKQIPVVWTLHDCWSFTGRCSHFESVKCFKWKDGCFSCPDHIVYPRTYFFDFSKKMWNDKKTWFNNANIKSIVTPSKWLANYVRQSYLGGFHLEVINNGIDLETFRIVKERSPYLTEAGERNIVLGVAASWTPKKGLDDFIKLYSILDDQKYAIVLVGLNARQKENLPTGIIGINRTNNVNELVEIYSNADVFVNPTYQDNYPTVNLEALACGSPVITYKTGGSVESADENVGMIVEQGDVEALKSAIEKVCNSSRYKPESCREYAIQHFGKKERYMEYMALYKSIMNK